MGERKGALGTNGLSAKAHFNFNPFQATGLFLHLIKALKTETFWHFQGVQKVASSMKRVQEQVILLIKAVGITA